MKVQVRLPGNRRKVFRLPTEEGAGSSPVVVYWVIGSIPYNEPRSFVIECSLAICIYIKCGVGRYYMLFFYGNPSVYHPLSYFSFQPVIHDWRNKGCGMCYPVCGMVHIKEPLLLIGVAVFLSYYLIGPLPYVQRHITVNKMC